MTNRKKSTAGRKGGKAGTGAAKRRNVDYAELGRKSGEARRAKKEEAKV